MYSEKEITKTLKNIFAQLLPEYSQEERNEMLEGLDFETIAQAVRDNARIVHAYEASGDYEKSFDYFGAELFPIRATKLCESIDCFSSDLVVTSHLHELWLREDMSVWVVSNMAIRVSSEKGNYLTEYRTIKGEMNADIDSGFMPEDLALELFKLCRPQFECEAPVYEV